MPRWFTRLRLRLRSAFRRNRVEQELDEELQYHLEREIDAGVAAGLAREDARYAALRALGALTRNKEECRDMRGVNWIEHLGQDLRYAARTLRKSPAFTTAALLALAVGIGANTAMFSVYYGMFLRALPFRDADRIAVVSMNYASRDFVFGTMCIRDYLMWKENNRAFEDPALYSSFRMDVGGTEGAPEQVSGASVTAGFFSTLGVRPLIGRVFAAGEDKSGTPSVAVLSESMWQRRFRASASVLGRIILVNGAPSTVIGVVAGAARFPRRDTEIWINLHLDPPARYGPWFYRGVARLKAGVTLDQAQLETNRIGLRMAQQNPWYKRVRLPVLGLRTALLGTTLKPAMVVLTGAVGLVLLISVVNVANLMLARATVREREMALRLSLGAGRGRLVRQLLTESVLLATTGGTAGLALAWGAIALIRAWNPGNLPLIDLVRLDWSALGFMVCVSMLAGVLFGMAPALESARADLNSTLKEGGRGAASSRGRGRMRNALVVSEVAISLMLLVGAGLLLRSFANLHQVTGGFFAPARRILTMRISPGDKKYGDARAGLAFYDEVLRRARSIPGVESAAVSDSLPPDRQGDADTFEIEGRPMPPGETNPVVSRATVGPDYFRTLGIPLLKGRSFSAHDNQESTPVAIVSEGFARRFLPGQEAAGKRIKYGDTWMVIVGVAGNVKYLGLTFDTDPAYYMPFAQSYDPRMFVAVRTSGEAPRVAETLRREIQSIDRGATLAQIGTMQQALDMSVSQPRFNTMLLGLFAGIALLLAAVGIYGLVAYAVAQRTQEIGVRVALGASPADVVRMVIRHGLSLAAIGIALGLGGAFGLTRLLKTMLFGVGITDALTFAAAPAGLLAAVLLATCLPAVRAARISAAAALRSE